MQLPGGVGGVESSPEPGTWGTSSHLWGLRGEEGSDRRCDSCHRSRRRAAGDPLQCRCHTPDTCTGPPEHRAEQCEHVPGPWWTSWAQHSRRNSLYSEEVCSDYWTAFLHILSDPRVQWAPSSPRPQPSSLKHTDALWEQIPLSATAHQPWFVFVLTRLCFGHKRSHPPPEIGTILTDFSRFSFNTTSLSEHHSETGRQDTECVHV